jgi:hypothetical protein
VPAQRPAAFDSEYRSIEAAGGADRRREALGAKHLSSVAVEKAPECVFVPFLLGWHDETPWSKWIANPRSLRKNSARTGRDETR